MTRLRWLALCVLTLACVLVSWASLPPRRPLIGAHHLSQTLRVAALLHEPARVCRRLENTALVAGLFNYDSALAEAERSTEARNAGLPALRPPVEIPVARRDQLNAALAWLQPDDAAFLIVDTAGQRESWVGLQGGRIGLVGRIAAWFVPHLFAGDSLWIRVGEVPLEQPLPTPLPTEGAAASAAPAAPSPTTPPPVEWLRPDQPDIAVLLPGGLPPALRAARAISPAEETLPALCRALGLPAGFTRLEGSLWLEPDRLRWEGRYEGVPAAAEPFTATASSASPPAPPASPHLPPPSDNAVFLTFRCNLDWPRLYHGLVNNLTAADRADFLRSMRYYRLAQKGYTSPEADLIDPLGCGLALVGRRGSEYAGNRLMPSLQAEIPLRPPEPLHLPTTVETPNQKFRAMMPDFAEARFDKVRIVGETNFTVHPSYVAVTTAAAFDRYVLVRPSIAGSALLPAWQVDESRIKIGTRPDVLNEPDLLRIEPSLSLPPDNPIAPAALAAHPAPTVALYFNPAGVTEQLDKFRILVMVEAGSDRPMPDEGITAERIEIENGRIAKRTAENMRIAAQIGWILKRLGPLTLEAAPEPPAPSATMSNSTLPRQTAPRALFWGSLELKAQP